jgi:hypothetical protein
VIFAGSLTRGKGPPLRRVVAFTQLDPRMRKRRAGGTRAPLPTGKRVS